MKSLRSNNFLDSAPRFTQLLRIPKVVAVLVLTVLIAACSGEYPQSTITPQTDFAEVIHSLYVNIFWWTMIILAVVWIAMAYILFRFREKPGQPRPAQVHGHLGLEIGWTIGPALIVVAIAIPSIQAVFKTQTGNGDSDYVVEVVGHRYWWEFRYPEGVVTANELHLPVGRPVALRLESADVIHSFWVPQLGGKRDVNPIRARPEGEDLKYNWLYFTINTPGVYMGQCAEFCGESHSLMGVNVVAESENDFERWLSDMASPAPTANSLAAAGASLVPEVAQQNLPAGITPELVEEGRNAFFGSLCVTCHAIQGTAAVSTIGPSLTRMGGRTKIASGWLDNTPEDLFRWIKDPQSVKPGALMPGAQKEGGGFPPTNLTDDQIRAIAAYLSSMR